MKCPTCSYQPVQKPSRHCPACGSPWPVTIKPKIEASVEKKITSKTTKKTSGRAKRNTKTTK